MEKYARFRIAASPLRLLHLITTLPFDGAEGGAIDQPGDFLQLPAIGAHQQEGILHAAAL
ncbi:hypothetical protein BA011_33475 (plasmid) [Rhizobium leguminosarum]|uniref:Uncharacterized protein n=1 Tax=Rhizobium leguminosarum TaxID=384 RepID=A0A179BCJ0_RHILE|nr:hypothetical protein BA011_33475 [Rhizobium leguminosarum]OAP89416.1 hypothetical protein A4U53_32875 [Rhizobium leguminosarum]